MRMIDADELVVELKEQHDYIMQCTEVSKNIKWCESVCFHRAIETIERLPTIEAEPVKWIPVTERLPEPFVSVLVQMPGERPFPTVREGFITKDGIWHSALYNREPDEVTHWMPMPQPPKMDGGADHERS